MDLTDQQLDRYARHIVLREIGGAGQMKLLKARVGVIGAGGLGAPVLMYLAAAGVGHLGIFDDDEVSLSNLQRQIIHTTARLGQAKTDSARETISALNADVKVSGNRVRVTLENAEELFAPYDLIIDGSDNFATRFVANDACHRLGKTLISAAVGPFDGQLSTFKSHDGVHPCYRCLVPEAPPGGGGTCADEGIMGALTGVLGSLAAMEAIKEITGAGESLAGKLLLYDGLSTRFRTVKLKRDPACRLCSDSIASHTASAKS